jgi:hypothetical protein
MANFRSILSLWKLKKLLAGLHILKRGRISSRLGIMVIYRDGVLPVTEISSFDAVEGVREIDKPPIRVEFECKGDGVLLPGTETGSSGIVRMNDDRTYLHPSREIGDPVTHDKRRFRMTQFVPYGARQEDFLKHSRRTSICPIGRR